MKKIIVPRKEIQIDFLDFLCQIYWTNIFVYVYVFWLTSRKHLSGELKQIGEREVFYDNEWIFSTSWRWHINIILQGQSHATNACQLHKVHKKMFWNLRYPLMSFKLVAIKAHSGIKMLIYLFVFIFILVVRR